jgi:hypothetical protein
LHGKTGLRFKRPASTNCALLVGQPGSYRPGIGYFTEKIVWSQLFEYQFDQRYLQRGFREYLEKIKACLAIHPTLDDQYLPCCWTLALFERLGRLAEIDSEPLITFLQNRQLANGGFTYYNDEHLAAYHHKYPDKALPCTVDTSLTVCGALATVGAEPKNKTALREYLASLQTVESISFPYDIGLFRDREPNIGEQGDTYSDTGATSQALMLLRLFNLTIPNKELLENHLEDRMDYVTEHFPEAPASIEELENQQNLLSWIIELAFFLGKKELLDGFLEERLWHIHNLYRETSAYLIKRQAVGFAIALTRVKRAGFNLDYRLVPTSFPKGATKQTGTLRINNRSPYPYLLTPEGLSCTNCPAVSVTLASTAPVTLTSNRSVDLPITISHNASEGTLPSTLTLRLTVTAPVTGIDGITMTATLPASSRVFFELPVTRPKNLSPAVLGLLVGLPTTTAAAAAGGTASYLRRKNKSKKKKTTKKEKQRRK